MISVRRVAVGLAASAAVLLLATTGHHRQDDVPVARPATTERTVP